MSHTLIMRDIIARVVKVPFKRLPTSTSGSLPEATLMLIDVATNAKLTGHA